MAKFTVTLQCIVTADVVIESDSITTLEEAKRAALLAVRSPPNHLIYGDGKTHLTGYWEFLDDSVEVNEDCTNELNAVPSQTSVTTTGG